MLEKRVAHSAGITGELKSFMKQRNQSCKRRMINLAKELELEGVLMCFFLYQKLIVTFLRARRI